MKTITKKQADAINAQCQNGFCLDVRHYVERGEKQLHKIITLTQGQKKIEVSLYWTEERNPSGYTGNVVPCLHCAVWHKSSTTPCWCSHGLGTFHELSDHPSPKRLMKALCSATALVDGSLERSLVPPSEHEAYDQAIGKTTDAAQ